MNRIPAHSVRRVIEPDIVVVGAGPVGLTAALAVRATGRPVAVVEAGAHDRVRPGSRAIYLHRVTLELLEGVRSGLGAELVRRGLVWRTKRTLYRGREVYRRIYKAPAAGSLPSATNLPQVVTEAVLLQACMDAGVEFVWNAEVVTAKADGRGVANWSLGQAGRSAEREADKNDGRRTHGNSRRMLPKVVALAQGRLGRKVQPSVLSCRCRGNQVIRVQGSSRNSR